MFQILITSLKISDIYFENVNHTKIKKTIYIIGTINSFFLCSLKCVSALKYLTSIAVCRTVDEPIRAKDIPYKICKIHDFKLQNSNIMLFTTVVGI